MIAAAEIRVEGGGEKVGEGADHGAGAHVPPPETRVGGAHRIREDVGAEFLVGGLGAGGLVGRG